MAPGYAPCWSWQSTGAGAEAECTLVLRKGGTLRGVVQAADGSPHANARVWVDSLHDQTSANPWEARTDDRGCYRIDGLAAGECRVWAQSAAQSQLVATSISYDQRPAAPWAETALVRRQSS